MPIARDSSGGHDDSCRVGHTELLDGRWPQARHESHSPDDHGLHSRGRVQALSTLAHHSDDDDVLVFEGGAVVAHGVSCLECAVEHGHADGPTKERGFERVGIVGSHRPEVRQLEHPVMAVEPDHLGAEPRRHPTVCSSCWRRPQSA